MIKNYFYNFIILQYFFNKWINSSRQIIINSTKIIFWFVIDRLFFESLLIDYLIFKKYIYPCFLNSIKNFSNKITFYREN